MRHTRRVLLFTACIAVSSTLLSTPASAADIGDGKLGCNQYEICFNRDSGTGRYYQKHFIYGARHDGYTFTDVRTGAGGKGNLRDNAWSVKNRDGSCKVKVIDERGIFADDVHIIPNDSIWYTLRDSVRDQNDRHERC